MKRIAILVVLAALAAGGFFLWQQRQQQRVAAPAGQAAPPPRVAVVEVRPADVPLTLIYAGRVASVRDVEVRAQVGGLLLQRAFPEGSRVAQGQALFRIDPRPYQTALDRANAQLAQAQATLRQTEDALTRTQELVRRQVSTEVQLDNARAARDQAAASVQLAEAEIRAAQLNLDFTMISAPVAGTTSLVSPAEGSLVQAQQTLLTTITVHDPAYVNFSIADAEYRAFRELNARLARPITEEDIRVALRYADGTAYDRPGRIDVSAQQIDPRTGTLQIRAVFPNPDAALLPGQFLRVVTTGITLPQAIVVPKAAIGQGPQGPFVYVVGGNSNAEVRPIRLGRELEQGWVVESGLSAGDRVVTDGVMRVRPGAPVTAVPGDPATGAPLQQPAAQPAPQGRPAP